MPLKILNGSNSGSLGFADGAFNKFEIDSALFLTNLFAGSAALPNGVDVNSYVRTRLEIPVDVTDADSCGQSSNLDPTQGGFRIAWQGEYTTTSDGVRGFPCLAHPTLAGRDGVGNPDVCGGINAVGTASRDNFDFYNGGVGYPDMDALNALYGLPCRLEDLPEIYIRLNAINEDPGIADQHNLFMDTYWADSTQNSHEVAGVVDDAGNLNGINGRLNRIYNLNFWIHHPDVNQNFTGGVRVAENVVINGINHNIHFKYENGGNNSFFYIAFVMLPPPGITEIRSVRFRYNDYVAFVNRAEFWNDYVQTNPLNASLANGQPASTNTGTAGQQIWSEMESPQGTRHTLAEVPLPNNDLVLDGFSIGCEMWGTTPGSGATTQARVNFRDLTIEKEGYPEIGLKTTGTLRGGAGTSGIDTEANNNTVSPVGFVWSQDPAWNSLPEKSVIAGQTLTFQGISGHIINNTEAYSVTGSSVGGTNFQYDSVGDTVTLDVNSGTSGQSSLALNLIDPNDSSVFDTVNVPFNVVQQAGEDANGDGVKDDSIVLDQNQSALVSVLQNDQSSTADGSLSYKWAPGYYYKYNSEYLPRRVRDSGYRQTINQLQQIAGRPEWNGFVAVIPWSALEPTYRNYDFSIITELLAESVAVNKFLGIHVVHSEGQGSNIYAPHWAQSVNGSCDLTDDATMSAFVEMMQALGAKFNAKSGLTFVEVQEIFFAGIVSAKLISATDTLVSECIGSYSNTPFVIQGLYVPSFVDELLSHAGACLGITETLATRRAGYTSTHDIALGDYPVYAKAVAESSIAKFCTVKSYDIFPFAETDYVYDDLPGTGNERYIDAQFNNADLLEISDTLEYLDSSFVIVEGGKFESRRPYGVNECVKLTQVAWERIARENIVANTSLKIDAPANIPLLQSASSAVVSVTRQPDNGSATVVGQSVVYTPNANYFGTDSFDYQLTDGSFTGSASVNVGVSEASLSSDPPKFVKQVKNLYAKQNESFVLNNVSELVSNSATAWRMEGVSLSGVSNFDYASPTDSVTVDVNSTDASFDIRLMANSSADMTTIYDTLTVNLNVLTGQDDDANADDAKDDVYVVQQGSSSLPVTANDEYENFTLSITGAASNGTANVSGNNIEYTPNAGFVGTDSFTYEIDGTNIAGLSRSLRYLDLGSNSNRVTIPSVPGRSTLGFTLSFWVYLNVQSNWNYLLGFADGDGGFGIQVGPTQLGMITQAATQSGRFFDNILQVGEWTHLTCVFAATNNWKIYKNAGLFAQEHGPAPAPAFSTHDWIIGATGGGFPSNYIDARIAEVRLFNTEVSTVAQAQNIMSGQAAIAGLTEVEHWKLDETAGLLAANSSGSIDGVINVDASTLTGVANVPNPGSGSGVLQQGTANVTVGVNPNDPYQTLPSFLVNTIGQTISQNDSLTFDLSQYVSNPDGLAYSISTIDSNISSAFSAPNLTLDTTGSVAGNATADVNLVYSGNTVATLTVSVSVLASSGSAISLSDDNVVAIQDRPRTINIHSNGASVPASAHIVVSEPNNGSIRLKNSGEIVYQPESDFSGSDSFQYTAYEGSIKDTATVNVTVLDIASVTSAYFVEPVPDQLFYVGQSKQIDLAPYIKNAISSHSFSLGVGFDSVSLTGTQITATAGAAARNDASFSIQLIEGGSVIDEYEIRARVFDDISLGAIPGQVLNADSTVGFDTTGLVATSDYRLQFENADNLSASWNELNSEIVFGAEGCIAGAGSIDVVLIGVDGSERDRATISATISAVPRVSPTAQDSSLQLNSALATKLLLPIANSGVETFEEFSTPYSRYTPTEIAWEGLELITFLGFGNTFRDGSGSVNVKLTGNLTLESGSTVDFSNYTLSTNIENQSLIISAQSSGLDKLEIEVNVITGASHVIALGDRFGIVGNDDELSRINFEFNQPVSGSLVLEHLGKNDPLPLSYSVTSVSTLAGIGDIEIDASGDAYVNYIPAPGISGTDAIVWQVDDGSNVSSATLTVEISA